MKIGIVGCAGRMGQMLIQTVLLTKDANLVGGSEGQDHPALDSDLGEVAGLNPLGLKVKREAREVFDAADVVVDFTLPTATVAFAALAAETETAYVVGTTGLGVAQQDAIAQAATRVAVVQAPNFSLGVNALLVLTEKLAQILGEDYDIEVLEMHHRHKVDAPSGTALGLGQAAARGRGVQMDRVGVMTRQGHTGERKRGDIGFATLRGGDVAGEHKVMFVGDGERVELAHKAGSRAILAKGAVRAALWTKGRPAGLYNMTDVIGLTSL